MLLITPLQLWIKKKGDFKYQIAFFTQICQHVQMVWMIQIQNYNSPATDKEKRKLERSNSILSQTC